MVSKKDENKDMPQRINELKIEILKQPTKKKSIKKQIARLLTEQNKKTKLGDKK